MAEIVDNLPGSPAQAEKANRKEQIEKIPWVFPDKIRQQMLTGANTVLDNILLAQSEKKPVALVVLQRKGELAFHAVQTLAERKGLELPKALMLPIGRSLTQVKQLIHTEPEYHGWDEHEKYINGQAEKEGSPINKVLVSARNALSDKPINRTIVIDDTKQFGVTEFTARTLLQRPDVLGVNNRITAQYVFPENSAWLNEILRTTFHLDSDRLGQNATTVTELLLNLMTGEYKDNTYGQSEGKKIETWDDVAKLGKAILQYYRQLTKNASLVKNPADVVQEMSTNHELPNKDTLLSLKAGFLKAIEEEVKK